MPEIQLKDRNKLTVKATVHASQLIIKTHSAL